MCVAGISLPFKASKTTGDTSNILASTSPSVVFDMALLRIIIIHLMYASRAAYTGNTCMGNPTTLPWLLRFSAHSSLGILPASVTELSSRQLETSSLLLP